MDIELRSSRISEENDSKLAIGVDIKVDS